MINVLEGVVLSVLNYQQKGMKNAITILKGQWNSFSTLNRAFRL